MSLKAKMIGIGAAMATVLALSAAQAQPWDDWHHHHHQGEWGCRAEVRDAERRYDWAVEHFGRHSDEARERRHELHRIQERCGWDHY